MPRTIRTKIYKFDELSEDAKQKAIEHYRNNWVEVYHIYDEANASAKKFHDIFNTIMGRNSSFEVSTEKIDDTILELSGLRLQKYIWNNYRTDLFKGKYFSLWSKKDVSYKHYKEGYPVLKSRYSKVIFDNSCVLTGVCWDMELLDPIYQFLEERAEILKDGRTFEDLIRECFSSLESSVRREEDSQYTDEVITENIQANEYEYTRDGYPFRG